MKFEFESEEAEATLAEMAEGAPFLDGENISRAVSNTMLLLQAADPEAHNALMATSYAVSDNYLGTEVVADDEVAVLALIQVLAVALTMVGALAVALLAEDEEPEEPDPDNPNSWPEVA